MAFRYFDSSPFDGAQLTAAGVPPTRVLERYQALARDRFASFPQEASAEELEALDHHLLCRLELEREERRMHFGALCLVAVLLFLIFPHLLSGGFGHLGLNLLALLLLGLLIPYVWVYFGYENRVRAMGLAHLRLLEAIAAQAERRSGPALSATARAR